MKIDPNLAVDMHTEYVLCERGQVSLHDGSATARAELGQETSAFTKFCRSLDPNKCFIVALIPEETDKQVFFRAREVASELGIHMQAPVDTPERLRSQWEAYRQMKQVPVASEDPEDVPEVAEDPESD